MDTDMSKSEYLLYEIVRVLVGTDSKVKIAKLQYLADFIHYAFNDRPISDKNVLYNRQKHGPLSLSFNSDLSSLVDKEYLANPNGYYHKCTDKSPPSELFSKKERYTLDFVLNKYSNLSYKDLKDISHTQIPYLSAEKGGMVHLYTAYNLVDEYPDYETN